MSNVVTAYMDAQAVGRNLGFYGDANTQFVRDNFPEVAELNDLKNQGVVDIFGNRRDAPGYSLSDSVDNPNPLVFSVDRESFPTADRLPVTDVDEMREIVGFSPSTQATPGGDTGAATVLGQVQGDIPTREDLPATEADVESLYRNILDREVDPYGLDHYTNMPYGEVERLLRGSPEYFTNEYYKSKFGTPLTYEQRALFPADMSLADRYAKIDSFAVPGGDTGTGTGGTGTGGTGTGGTGTGGISTLSPSFDPTGAIPIDLGLERTFRGVVGRDPRQEDYDFYLKEFGDVFDFADRADLTRRLRPEQLERFDRQLGLPSTVRRDAAGNIPTTPALDFSSFGATPATAGIARLKPTDTTGTMAGVFDSPQFTSPFSIQTEQQQLPNTFTQLGDLFGEQFKADLRAEAAEEAAAEEAAGNRAGGLASLGYRRGGVVDENGIPRLFIGGLFKGIGRALKGITKIAPFILPFIPGFQALTLPMQSLIAGGVGGFRDGKFDLKRALTSGLTTYGIGKLAQAAGTPVGPEGGGVNTPVETFPDGTIKTAANPGVNDPGIVSAGAGKTTNFQLPDPKTGAPTVTTGIDNIAQGSIVRSAPLPPTDTSSFTRPMSTAGASTAPSGFGLDRLKAEAVGTGQRIGDTFSNIASGNVESGKLIAPTLTTVGGISATKAADEIAKQEAEYKALTAADEAEKERKRRLALEAIRRNPFGYNEGGISSLPARYLDGEGDGMSDSIRANIGGMQEARLADGEFVVPADVVADLGNGSSNAGAERLYSMMDRIRQARHGTTKQPPEVNVNKTLPA